MPCGCGNQLYLGETMCFPCRDAACERFGLALRPLMVDRPLQAHIHAATHAAMTRILEAARAANRRPQVR